MGTKPKLELTWIGKENCPKLEPRILLEDPARSYHARHRVTDKDCFDNRLIFGDNLLALKRWKGSFRARSSAASSTRPTTPGAPSPITTMGWSTPSGCP